MRRMWVFIIHMSHNHQTLLSSRTASVLLDSDMLGWRVLNHSCFHKQPIKKNNKPTEAHILGSLSYCWCKRHNPNSNGCVTTSHQPTDTYTRGAHARMQCVGQQWHRGGGGCWGGGGWVKFCSPRLGAVEDNNMAKNTWPRCLKIHHLLESHISCGSILSSNYFKYN